MDVYRGRFWASLIPKFCGYFQRFDFEISPPDHLIAGLMQLPMMASAERYRELVADFEAQGSGLGKSQVMRIRRLPAAYQARLRGNKP